MPARSTLALIDTIAMSPRHAGALVPGAEVSAQAAFVRALVDEVERHHPADDRVAPLREQLGEELSRLADIIGGTGRPLGAGGPGDPRERPIDVLVVDDDEGALTAAAAVLKSLGYPSRTASSAEEALRELDREPAAIVLSDWCMPGMSGLELCDVLKRREHAPYVILASGYHENARLLEGAHGGVDDFLRKPLDVGEMEVRLFAASRLIRALRTVSALRDQLQEMERAPGS